MVIITEDINTNNITNTHHKMKRVVLIRKTNILEDGTFLVDVCDEYGGGDMFGIVNQLRFSTKVELMRYYDKIEPSKSPHTDIQDTILGERFEYE